LTLEFRSQPANWLWYLIIKSLDQAPWRFLRALVINLQSPPVRDDRCPNILIREALTDLPGLAREANRPIRRSASDEMHLPGSDWQPFWQRGDLFHCQPLAPLTAPRLRW